MRSYAKMCAMSDGPKPPPEAELIAAALKRARISGREAARRAGISDVHWRQIVSGYQTVSGTRVPVTGPAATIARMASVVGVTPEELAEAGRNDAADALRALPDTSASQTSDLAAQVEALRARLAELEERFNQIMGERGEHGTD